MNRGSAFRQIGGVVKYAQQRSLYLRETRKYGTIKVIIVGFGQSARFAGISLSEVVMKIQESGENYLETILLLQRRNGSVRSIDIATELGFTKPSISRAMGVLRQAGYITNDAHGYIQLTDEGRVKAESVYERHVTISQYLSNVLGVNKEVADHDACRIEHVISEEVFEKMKQHLERQDG
ncbi:iron dependent repressor DNA binding domain protein [[Clostridium] methylpentosum DSM 5476]|uniref:Iron dependent repressor DNA binding domain protein n=1 Tax=[Clostridium] methylpentosum DSM 5476 TaxID=537013 RepID=C0EGA1_9FIRM|nr:iron dependent repressor DNA binding domain protein [[Clostridium] methylpentosum DSM 5476]